MYNAASGKGKLIQNLLIAKCQLFTENLGGKRTDCHCRSLTGHLICKCESFDSDKGLSYGKFKCHFNATGMRKSRVSIQRCKKTTLITLK